MPYRVRPTTSHYQTQSRSCHAEATTSLQRRVAKINNEGEAGDYVMIMEWLIWQLIDSAFPSGGFVHSGGLEAASQLKIIHDRESLYNFIDSYLMQCVSSSLKLMLDAFLNVDKNSSFSENFSTFEAADKLAQAVTTNHIANKASRAQGQSLLSSAAASFPDSGLKQFKHAIYSVYGHYPPVFGLICKMLDIEIEKAKRMFLFVTLRGLMSTAVRLNIIGPLEAQTAQHSYGSFVEQLLKQDNNDCTNTKEIFQTSPLLDIIQGSHDKLYSKIFST